MVWILIPNDILSIPNCTPECSAYLYHAICLTEQMHRIVLSIMMREVTGSGTIAIIIVSLVYWDLERMCFLAMRLHQRSLFSSFCLASTVTFLLLSYLYCVTWFEISMSSFTHSKKILGTCCILTIAFSDAFCLVRARSLKHHHKPFILI